MIRAKKVRLIDPDGKQLGVVDLSSALEKAEEMELDLVEIAPNSKPPVCRIMDYSRHRYQQQRRDRQAKRNSQHTKVREVRLRVNIADHDLEVKEKTIDRLVGKGDKVRVSVRLRGRDHAELGLELMARIREAMAERVEVIQEPRHHGREITMVLGPLHGQESS